jgi:hypothetical protein
VPEVGKSGAEHDRESGLRGSVKRRNQCRELIFLEAERVFLAWHCRQSQECEAELRREQGAERTSFGRFDPDRVNAGRAPGEKALRTESIVGVIARLGKLQSDDKLPNFHQAASAICHFG